MHPKRMPISRLPGILLLQRGKGGVYRQINLALLASALNTMFAGLPFGVAEELHPGAVHQQVQRPFGEAIRDLDAQRFLPLAQCCVVKYRPIHHRHFEQDGHQSRLLAKRHIARNFDRQAKQDRRVGRHRRPTEAAIMQREPGHIFVQPDQEGSALARRARVAKPVPRTAAGR